MHPLRSKDYKQKKNYIIRESYKKGELYLCRDLFDFGNNPDRFIKYPDGNSYYINEEVCDALQALISDFDYDEFENIFWPFLQPEIKRSIKHFNHRGSYKKKTLVLSLNLVLNFICLTGAEFIF